MTRTKTLALAAVLAVGLTLTGCSEEPNASQKAKADREQKAKDVVLCGAANDSLECKNLKEREKRNSQPNAIGYVYLYNFDGSVKGYFTIKGKVSSTQSQMAPMDVLVDGCNRSGEDCPQAMEAAGDDGSFGPNESGIFFFTTEGVMVTYSGEYVLSDAPLKLSTNKLN
jgi:outer membrane murein-binding lipoprotein Lpp